MASRLAPDNIAQSNRPAADENQHPDAEDHERLGISDDLIYGQPDEDNGGYRMQPRPVPGIEVGKPRPAEEPPAMTKPPCLRDAASAVLAAWDACPSQDATDKPIARAVEALRAALAC